MQSKKLSLTYNTKQEYDEALKKLNDWEAKTDYLLSVRLGKEKEHRERMGI